VILRVGLVALAAVAVVSSCSDRRHRPATTTAGVKHGTIVRVVDGDTVRVRVDGQERSVRLIGIDTPETHKPGVRVECGGREASANAERLAPVGAQATLTPDPSQDSVDRYGRLLAYVYVNHRSLQLEQVYAGWAEVYVYRGHPFARTTAYERAQAVARRQHRGVWGACGGDFHSLQPGRR
jgi:micrococcal nuclease